MFVTLPDGHLQVVCKFGQGKDTCAFLALSGSRHACVKGSSFEAVIRARWMKEPSMRRATTALALRTSSPRQPADERMRKKERRVASAALR